MANELKGTEAWVKAFGLLVTFMSVRAAFHAIRQSEGTAPAGEQVILLRSIDKKLARMAPPVEEVEDLNYHDVL